jgi:hypothetical protein
MYLAEYQRIYGWVYRNDPDYGAFHGRDAVGIVAEKLQSGGVLVDVGCGRHQFTGAIADLTPATVYGLDIINHKPPQGVTSLMAPAWDLSGVDEPVTVITSFDVLEHIYPEDVELTLTAWANREPQMVVVSIAYRPSTILGPGGVNLHPSVKDEAWWKCQLIRRFGPVRHWRQYLVFGG